MNEPIAGPFQIAKPSRMAVLPIIRAALVEDIGPGDITSETTIPQDATAEGWLLAKADGLVCGLWVVELVLSELDPAIKVDELLPEATTVTAGDRLGRITGPARSVLAGERVALNLLQRMSGIATLRTQAVEAVQAQARASSIRARPRLAFGAGEVCRAHRRRHNHRFTLSDGVLIKDNHIRPREALQTPWPRPARAPISPVKIEVETETLESARSAGRRRRYHHAGQHGHRDDGTAVGSIGGRAWSRPPATWAYMS